MSPWDHIDQYCERLDATLWSEPLNALSNLAFILAAAFLWRDLKRAGLERSRPFMILVALVGVVGIGSALFHTIATVWAMAADVIPICAALFWILLVLLRDVTRSSWGRTVAWLAVFGVVTAAFGLLIPKAAVNGSQTYFSCVFALAAAGIHFRRAGDGAIARRFYAGAGIFIVSLLCRSIDLATCDSWPLGTHFLWHTLNGITLYLAGSALIQARGKSKRSEPRTYLP